MSYRIGSLNLKDFSAKTINVRDIRKIANILRDSHFDIIAIQEICDEYALKRLVGELGTHRYAGSWAKPVGITAQASEGYAFIWDKMRIELFQTNKQGKKVDVLPFIMDTIPEGEISPGGKLTRNPYLGLFKPKKGINAEFRLINTHILFGSVMTPDIEKRKMEYLALLKDVYPWLADKVYWRNRTGVMLGSGIPSYTILLGDYNLNIGKYPQLDQTVVKVDRRRIRSFITVQSEDTTLKKPPTDSEQPDQNINDYWKNNYDHFSYEIARFNGVKIKTHRMDSTKYCKDYAEHFRVVSDHVPVFIELDFRNGR